MFMHAISSPVAFVAFAEALPEKSNVMLRHDMFTPVMSMHEVLLAGTAFRVQGSGFRVQGSGFMVQGSGFRVQGSGLGVSG